MISLRSLTVFLLAAVIVWPVRSMEDDAAAEYRKKIDNLIRDHNYHATSNPHYVIKTDDPRIDIEAAAALLESFHAYFEEFWSDRAELRGPGDRSRIYLFYSRYKYKQLLDEFASDDLMETVGHYTARHDVIALHTDTVGVENLADLLLHEAAHRLIQIRLYGNSSVPSPWVSEGLASYFGNTLRVRSGEFRTGKIGGKGTTFFDGVSPTTRGSASHSLAAYRKALKRGETTALEEIVSIQGEDFYREDGAAERYTASWLLVHFLLHAEDGAHAPALARYMELEAEGRGGPEAFFEETGMSPERLSASLAGYISSLKAR